MNVSLRHKYAYSSERYKRESAREFIEQYFDSSHVPIVMSLAEELNMTIEEATANALAMFNSMQDLFNMHHTLHLHHVKIEPLKGIPRRHEDREFVFEYRRYLKEPYLKNAATAWEKVRKKLQTKAKKLASETKSQKNKREWAKFCKERAKKDAKRRASKKYNKKLAKKRRKRMWRIAIGI